MSQFDAVFAGLVVFTFLLQVLNYAWFDHEKKWMLPMSNPHRLLFITVLTGFCVTEGMLAVERPIYGLYVLLNLYGIKCLWRRP